MKVLYIPLTRFDGPPVICDSEEAALIWIRKNIDPDDREMVKSIMKWVEVLTVKE